MQYTAKDIARMLSERADSVAKYLLPGGKVKEGNWCVGDLSGRPGDSLKVQLRGPKAGVWADFASGENERGDLLDLWSQVRNVKLGQAFKDACEYLNIWRPSLATPPRVYAKPPPNGIAPISRDTDQWGYLTVVRGLRPPTIAAYRLGQKTGAIVFPYWSPQGELLNAMTLQLERSQDGKKRTSLEKGCELCLWGWQAIDSGSREILIAEGQIDACTWFQWGIPALSVPNGCASTEWIDSEWDNLQTFDTIYLSYDMDEEGRKHVRKVAERLGLHRCRVVELPHKDANECLQAGCTAEDAARWIAASRYLSPPEICEPGFFRLGLHEFYFPSNDDHKFYTSFIGNRFEFRPMEVTLFSGTSGHGKSTLWSHCLVEAVSAGMRGAVASLEVPCATTLGIMAAQWFGTPNLSRADLDQFLGSMAGHLWLFDLLGTVPSTKIMELCRYARARYAVDFIVIDSLMKLDIDADDYNSQKKFLNELTTFAKQSRCHVWLVAHPRKARDESYHPGKLDIKGASEIGAQADNVVLLWRNKEKEQQREEGKEVNPDEGDALLVIDKQRLTGVEFRRKLWFLPGARQYTPNPKGGPAVFGFRGEQAAQPEHTL